MSLAFCEIDFPTPSCWNVANPKDLPPISNHKTLNPFILKGGIIYEARDSRFPIKNYTIDTIEPLQQVWPTN